MTINFAPRRGAILLCDFGPEGWIATKPTKYGPLGVEPEVDKLRRCVVVSDDRFNLRHGMGPGVCMVVPCSASEPRRPDETMVPLLQRNYRAITKDVWVKCSSIMCVSHDRLDRPRVGGYRVMDYVSGADMALIEVGLKLALRL